MHKRELVALVIQEYRLSHRDAVNLVRRVSRTVGRRNEGNWDFIYGQIQEALGQGDDFRN
jgi:hypothetical protein